MKRTDHPHVAPPRHARRPHRLALALLASLAACGGSAPAATPTPRASAVATPAGSPSPTGAPSPRPSAAPTPPPLPSPVLIQVENQVDARPQAGLSQAAIVYEYNTEGGISRFTAIYFVTPHSPVGPVRSARLVTVPLTQLYGGLIIYSGSDNYVAGHIRRAALPLYNENNAGGDLYRVSDRYAPHNLFTDGPRIDDLRRRASLPGVGYQLWPRTTAAAGLRPLAGFTVPVSQTERPRYTWHPELGGWMRTEPDTGVLTDAATGRPLVASTVVVMQVPARIDPNDIEDINGAAGWDYTLTGGGGAQIFTAGGEVDGGWTQNPAGGPPALTVAGGALAPVAPGLVWICLVPTGTLAG